VQEEKREHVPGGTGATLQLSIHWARKNATGEHARGDWTGLATVLHGNSPRLLAYDGIDIEAELAGTLIIIRNHDVPGVIGRIGTLLGEAQLNIASFALGRRRHSGAPEPNAPQALAVIQLDELGSQPALERAVAELRRVPAITSVRVVDLPSL